MDLNALVSAIADAGDRPSVRLRQGVIVSVAADYTVTVTIGGSSTQVTGVKVASSVCPVPGATCWLVTDGRDWMVLATLAPSGPAVGSMRKGNSVSISTGTWTDMGWGTRVETISVGTTLGSTGITVLVPGLYQVSANITLDGSWPTTWATAGNIFGSIMVNGTVRAQMSGTPAPSVAANNARVAGSALLALAANDLVNTQVYQNSGSGKGTTLSAGANFLSVVWVGPGA